MNYPTLRFSQKDVKKYGSPRRGARSIDDCFADAEIERCRFERMMRDGNGETKVPRQPCSYGAVSSWGRYTPELHKIGFMNKLRALQRERQSVQHVETNGSSLNGQAGLNDDSSVILASEATSIGTASTPVQEDGGKHTELIS